MRVAPSFPIGMPIVLPSVWKCSRKTKAVFTNPNWWHAIWTRDAHFKECNQSEIYDKRNENSSPRRLGGCECVCEYVLLLVDDSLVYGKTHVTCYMQLVLSTRYLFSFRSIVWCWTSCKKISLFSSTLCWSFYKPSTGMNCIACEWTLGRVKQPEQQPVLEMSIQQQSHCFASIFI